MSGRHTTSSKRPWGGAHLPGLYFDDLFPGWIFQAGQCKVHSNPFIVEIDILVVKYSRCCRDVHIVAAAINGESFFNDFAKNQSY